MDDNSALLKMVIILGAIMLLVSSLNPAANEAWGTFTGALESGPAFPSFNAPGSIPSSFVTLFPVANSTPSDPPWNVTGCAMANYYECLTPGPTAGPIQEATLRSAGSFGDNNVSVLLTSADANPGLRVMTIRVRIVCNITGAISPGVNLAWTLSHAGPGVGPTFFTYGVECEHGPRVTQYWNMTGVDYNTSWTLGSFSGAYMQLSGSAPFTNITLVAIDLGLSSIALCGGGLDGIACQISNALIALWTGVIAVGSAIVFGLLFIGALIVFLATLIAGIIVGLFTSFLYFFALPGAPPIVQGAIDVLFIAFLLIIGFMLLRVGTGLFGGAVNKT